MTAALHDLEVLVFRRRYNLSPRDPRLLALTPLEIELDNELALVVGAAARGEEVEPATCDQCGSVTYQERCPECPGRPALALLERLVEREEAGATIDWQREYYDLVDEAEPLAGVGLSQRGIDPPSEGSRDG